MTPPPSPLPSPSPATPSWALLGRRIAWRRLDHEMTQQELAERIAISRVAMSNLESGRSVPGERTVTLLAGVFGVEPHELVDGTDYPRAKADRLPPVTARHTEVELQLRLLERDLRWLESAPRAVAVELLATWRRDLRALRAASIDQRERAALRDALDRLA